MSYKITEDCYTKCFENHKATLKTLNNDTQTLEWKEPGTRFYQVDYVFHKNMLFVSGDIGEASFSCTWCPKWDTDNGWLLSLDYLFGKLSAIKGDKYEWNSDDAIKNLKDHYEESFYELEEEDFDNMSAYIIEQAKKHWYQSYYIDDDEEEIPCKELVDKAMLLQYCTVIKHAVCSSNESEFAYSLQGDEQFDDFNDFWEWGYSCGRSMNSRIEYYLAGLQMAYEQLTKGEKDEKHI